MPHLKAGLCLRCHKNERAGTCNVMDEIVYSHVCQDCQDECEAYYPCLICGTELGDGPNLEANELFICEDCHDKIKRLLAMDFTPRQIAGAYHGSFSYLQQICEAVQIGRDNWLTDSHGKVWKSATAQAVVTRVIQRGNAVVIQQVRVNR